MNVVQDFKLFVSKDILKNTKAQFMNVVQCKDDVNRIWFYALFYIYIFIYYLYIIMLVA